MTNMPFIAWLSVAFILHGYTMVLAVLACIVVILACCYQACLDADRLGSAIFYGVLFLGSFYFFTEAVCCLRECI